jgi:release factor glutamine methyltransferase
MTARDALDAAVTAIEAAGCTTPRLDAELLIADAVGVDRSRLVMDPDMEIPPAAARVIGEHVRRRVAREPVAYILGRKGFRHIELAVDQRAIIPRPETELLVDIAGSQPAGARVHDVGTGAGAIALALLDERPDLHVTASEPYACAAAVARENADRLGLPLEVSDEAGLPEGDYDLVVANLPYVREGDWEQLQPEIRRYEPREAFIAGEDGLDAIRELVAAAPSGTRLALEHGNEQGAEVRDMLEDAESYPDLANWERITVGRVP